MLKIEIEHLIGKGYLKQFVMGMTILNEIEKSLTNLFKSCLILM